MFKYTNINRMDTEILAFMCRRPDDEWHVRLLSRESGISTGAASEGLKRLQNLCLLERKVKGKMVFYRLVQDNPAVRSFKKTMTLLALASVVNSLKDISDRVYLFGSAADGSDTTDSDIDLLVVSSSKDRVQRKLKETSNINGHPLRPIILSPSELVRLSKNDKAFHSRATDGILLWRNPHD